MQNSIFFLGNEFPSFLLCWYTMANYCLSFSSDLQGKVVTPLLCVHKVVGLNPGSNGWVIIEFFSDISGDHYLSYGVCALGNAMLTAENLLC